MLFGSSPFAAVPISRHDFATATTISDPTYLRQNPRLRRQHLVIASVVDSGGSPVTAQWSDLKSYLEEAFPHRVERAIDFESSILSHDLTAGGLGRPAVGSIRVVRNADDSADFASWIWDGRPLTVKVGLPGANLGSPGWTLSRFIPALVGEVRGITARSDSFTILLRDAGIGLRDALQGVTYAGTGGLEGSDDLAGQTKPFCYGENRNMRPRLVTDPASGLIDTYQIHDRLVEAITAVYDGGVPYTAAGGGANDIADLALASVLDWTPVSGQYITDLTNGVFRVGSPPSKDITCDAQGDADASLGGYVSTTADIVERILRQRAGYSAAQLNANSFGRLNIDIPGSKGFYSDSGAGSIESVLNALLQPMAWARFDELARIEVGNLKKTTPSLSLSGTQVLEVERIESPPVVHELTLGYAKSWVIQREDALLAGASDAQRAFVAEEYRTTAEEDAAVEALHLGSRELRIDTLFVNESDAASERARLFALLSSSASAYQISAQFVQGQVKPGATIRLFWSDFGLSGGRDLVVLDAHENSQNAQTRIVAWG